PRGPASARGDPPAAHQGGRPRRGREGRGTPRNRGLRDRGARLVPGRQRAARRRPRQRPARGPRGAAPLGRARPRAGSTEPRARDVHGLRDPEAGMNAGGPERIGMRRAAVLVAAVSVATAAACGPRAHGPIPGQPFVLISVDTLRSDHLPSYGYSGLHTPSFDALARDSIVFERAFSHYPLTLPSHASVFTGLLPPAHGVRNNKGYALADA